jgi:hypothetical protein
MSTYSSTPSTLAIAQAIVTYAQALTYPNSSTLVYTAVTLGQFKDLTSLIAASGTACLEVYGNQDDSQHKGFGGKVTENQSWYLMSLVNLNNAAAAEALIFQVRDALVQPFQTHATLGNAGTVYHAQIKPNSGRFMKVPRNQVFYRTHVIEVYTKSEWAVMTPPGVIS